MSSAEQLLHDVTRLAIIAEFLQSEIEAELATYALGPPQADPAERRLARAA